MSNIKQVWQRVCSAVGHWRLLRLFFALIILWGVILPVLGMVQDLKNYKLTASTENLIGSANSNLSAKFDYDANNDVWQFNKDGSAKQAADLKTRAGNDKGAAGAAAAMAQLKAQVGGGGKKDKSMYSVDLAGDAKKGVTYYDNNTDLSFKMTPQFKLQHGKRVQGRVVYPFAGGGQLVYTAKTNGLKEDIVLKENIGDSLSYDYKLNLPDTLEARLRDDGSLGIYAADPSLFGNITYGSTEDQTKVEAARKTAEKTNVVFVIPAPIVKDGNGKEASSVYKLDENILTVSVNGLDKLSYPLTVDPSVVVTSTSDFQSGGNNEGSIDYSASGEIDRGDVTGGTTGSWSTTSAFTTARSGHTSVAYNGYLYVIGGTNGSSSYLNDVQYAPINANGTIGTWTATTSFSNARKLHTSVAYNGYLYVIGGTNGSSSYLNDVQYAPINADGTVGTWATTASFTTPRYGHTSVAYNGYLYVIGGLASSGYLNDVQYAPINADGTVGTWATTASFTTPRYGHTSVAYNGYLYVIGGGFSGPPLATVQYAPINANGTVGTWATTTSFTTGRYGHTSVAYKGYLYVIGGSTNVSGSTKAADIQYAPINANGTIGTWTATTAITTARSDLTSVAYNGYLYVIGGIAGSGYLNDAQYSKISSPGVIGTTAFGTTTALTTARFSHASVSYNGYVYVLGGTSSGGTLSTVEYAPMNANGTIGSWTATTALTTARYDLAAVIYNGYLYVSGGYDASTSYLDSVQYAPINTDGTLGSWSTTTAFTNARYAHTFVAYKGYLYVIGGNDASVIYNDVQYAPINTNGTIGAWTTTTALTSVRAGHTSEIYNGYLYVIGGTVGSGVYTNIVQYAPINTDGTIGAWTTTTALTNNRSAHTSVVYNGYLYVIGGSNPTKYNTVQYAPINTDGTIGTWITTTAYTTASNSHTTIVYNGYLYIMGGFGSTYLNTVQYAPLNIGGSGVASTWTSTSSFTTARYGHTSVAYNGYLYIIGGQTNAGAYLNDVQYAPINADGTIGTWATTSPFTTARGYYASVVYNGYLYIMGGNGSSGSLNDVQYAPINTNGTLGSWTTTTAFTTARYRHTSVAYNGYLYIIGGSNTFPTSLNDVQYAPINTNGTLGSWTTTTAFTTARQQHTSVAYNGYLYVIGGQTTVSTPATLEYAPINTDGTIGTWTTTTLSGGRYSHTSVAYNGYLYVIGGRMPTGTLLNDVQYAPINGNGSIGTWTTTTAFNTTRYSHTSVAYNGYLYVIGGWNSTTVNTVQYSPLSVTARVANYSKLITLPTTAGIGSVNYNGTLGPGSSVTYKTATSTGVLGLAATAAAGVGPATTACGVGGTVKYVWVSVDLDDSQMFTWTGNQNASNITDITVNYNGVGSRAAPNQRLHGGKFFLSQSLQPLDTCGA